MDIEKIYDEYFKDIFNFLLGLTSNHNLAEELTQESFFKAMKNLDSYKPDKNIKAWLFTIARNTLYSYYRKNKNISSSHIDGIDEAISGNIHFTKYIEDKDLALEIHKYLHSMDEPYREVFNLRVFGELSYKHIGNIFNKTDGWARVVFYRAKKEIVNWLEERGDFHE